MAPIRRVFRAPRRGALLFLALICGAPLTSAAPGAETVHVRSVTDGDTVTLTDGRHVRLIGVNAPETAHDGRPAEPLAYAARERLAALIGTGTLTLEFEAERRDHYGRELAHLWLPDGRLAQDDLLERGLAAAIAVPPNIGYLERYLAAEAGARQARRGLWGDPYFAPRASGGLDAADQGFRFVRGTVERVGQSRKYVYLDLARRMSLMISLDDWKRYFGAGDPATWRGRPLVARGWVREMEDGRLRMRVRHPGMIAPAE